MGLSSARLVDPEWITLGIKHGNRAGPTPPPIKTPHIECPTMGPNTNAYPPCPKAQHTRPIKRQTLTATGASGEKYLGAYR